MTRAAKPASGDGPARDSGGAAGRPDSGLVDAQVAAALAHVPEPLLRQWAAAEAGPVLTGPLAAALETADADTLRRLAIEALSRLVDASRNV